QAPAAVSVLHRWSGTIAFIVTLPVAFHCLWALGFGTTSSRVIVHSVAGCVFYGAYASKMLGLRVRGLSGWTLPVLGGTVFAARRGACGRGCDALEEQDRADPGNRRDGPRLFRRLHPPGLHGRQDQRRGDQLPMSREPLRRADRRGGRWPCPGAAAQGRRGGH